ncbi:3-deoxy-7-phosphoheptulonate synthase [Flavimobilis sp. GY10621]|uniref:Phospho-2-dehydro-3-deoxyheptonate aldolase n=1 Tax=Flavimobilis rhizosphaerae TaxID=2775421 RepID=A0ABR9DNK4_9MICO|nr:3-deoxy-7-phosphoheptulonate synthase [Flavimobilis rhizosphaerae]MBD9698544.1 3-deoxy-7-phosphoheptulonate synthase [Flavimobilis rhizosphaerae]
MTATTPLAPATSDLRVRELDPLPTPAEMLADLPLTGTAAELVARSRDEVRRVLAGEDDRLVVVVGPCSVHDADAALDYAQRLAALVPELEKDLCVVMRVYFEKPRTTVGWKGLINDPDLDGTHDIRRGLRLAREVLLGVLDEGVPAACEFLEPTSPQFIADAVTWGAIGARNAESQVHRQLASGLSMPVGFKNATDGDVKIAVDGCITAAAEHTFFGIDSQGRAAAVATAGNPDCHVILRGGRSGPNYDDASVSAALDVAEASGLGRRLMIDASHGNSGKSWERQAEVVREIGASVAAGNHEIAAVMMESFIVAGAQKPAPSGLVYGRSVTDECLDWGTTAELLRGLAADVRARRTVEG